MRTSVTKASMPPPYSGEQGPVVQLESFNESLIPKLSELLEATTEVAKAFETIRSLAERQDEWETKSLAEIAQSELFLAQIGYLSLANREKLKPLAMTDQFFKELEKFDMLPERECLSVSVIFCRSAEDGTDDILTRRTISQDFDQFLTTLGWPVNIATHEGFRGSLTNSICETAPYYASTTIEVIFHSPYHIHLPSDGILPSSDSRNIAYLSKRRMTGAGISSFVMGSTNFADSEPLHENSATTQTSTANNSSNHLAAPLVRSDHDITSSAGANSASEPSVASSTAPQNVTARSLFTWLTSEDLISIVWVEDISKLRHLIKRISALLVPSVVIFLIVHPFPLTPGLYRVRILTAGGVAMDDPMALGPLTDGVVVSRHTLGLLVRLTAVRAHVHAKAQRGSYRKP
ncbi:Ral GTPase-activating protein subunit alpha-1 [Irineochytrium annulatum]|nr:Ral GTPase-activating protein subunit alpha-1 [Irineochytrium annulatum]